MPKFNKDKVERLILEQISKNDDRGSQIMAGPSEAGGCFYCTGKAMARMLPGAKIKPSRFGLAAWQGTALHHYIEHTFDIPNAIHERKLDVFEIEGYGTIRGSTDLYLPDFACTVDWKRQNKYSYDLTRLDGVSTKYIVQQMMYGRAWKNLGEEVEYVGICSIPGFSNNLDDIRFYWMKYDDEIVEIAKHNLETIWLYVQDGEWDELPSDEDCYQCNTYGR